MIISFLKPKRLVLIIALAFVQTVVAQSIELAKTKRGTTEQQIAHTGYTTSYNKDWRIPNWVAWELTKPEANGKGKRNGGFCPDPKVKGKSAETYDYSRSGYDRGHMAPAGDMKWSDQAMQESFYLSNICPQSKPLNNGLWKVLEERTRGWAKHHGGVFVCCGPIMDRHPRTIGKGKVAVPRAFFKVLCIRKGNFYHAIGFIFPNTDCAGDIWRYACTVDQVEEQTGHDFFFALPNNIESAMESTWDPKFWRNN